MAAPLGDLRTLGMTGSHVTVGAGAGEVVAGGQDRPGGEGHGTVPGRNATLEEQYCLKNLDLIFLPSPTPK